MRARRSCLILGSGRSGTSMVAGTLAACGYEMGANAHKPRAANPKGFFETPEINGINEELLAPHLPVRPALADGQRWLGIPRTGAEIRATQALAARIRAAVANAPFCIKDPRLSFTLPAWRPYLPSDTSHVVVFRDPSLTAQSILEECRTARYLRGVLLDTQYALDLWTAMYRNIVGALRARGDWLFLHYDQVLSNEGLTRLGAFLGVAVDASFPDAALRRAPAGGALPGPTAELYAELCELAGVRTDMGAAVSAPAPAGPVDADPTPAVSVIAFVGPGQDALVPQLEADVRAQRGVTAELILVDARHPTRPEEALLAEAGAHVVRGALHDRGRSYRAALESCRGRLVALLDPTCRPLPTWLARSLAALSSETSADEPALATCDYFLSDADGQFVDRAHPAAMGEAPSPHWRGGVLLTRAALASIETLAFWPVELALYQRLRAEGRVVHVTEPGYHVPREAHAAAWERSRQDAALLALARRPHAGVPELSVSLCTFDRADVLLECLEAFCRQLLPPGTFELVLTDDGSRDATPQLLEGLDFPLPVQRVRQENGGLASARNKGLELVRAPLVLFANDDTIAFPDLVETHLRAHARLRSRGRFAVLGSFQQPPAALNTAIARYLEASNEMFGYADMTPGEDYDAMRFYTCNVSVATSAVRSAGGFDTSFRHYGCEDTDLALRLEAQGFRVHYCGEARAWHHHVMDFDYLARRQRTVAKAFVRFFIKHPQVLASWHREELTPADCRAKLDPCRGGLSQLEDAARELARVDTAALIALGEPFDETARNVETQLAQLVRALNQAWWLEGFLEGFELHGLEDGFAGLTRALRARSVEEGGDPPPQAPQPARQPSRLERLPEPPAVTVVVPTHDRPDCLLQLVAALAAQDLEPDRFEVLVVDDASRRPAADVLSKRAWPLDLTVLRQEGGGPGRARNLALERARGRVVVFLNDDAVPSSDNLRRHLRSHLGAPEPRAVLGTFALLPELVDNSFAQLVETTNLLFAQPLMKAGVLYAGLSLCTGNVSLSRDVLERAGGFDPAFPFAGGEDSELGLRLERTAGVRVLYDPEIRAGHDHRLTVRDYARRQRVLGWSVHRMASKHGDTSLISGTAGGVLDTAFWDSVQAHVESEEERVQQALAEVEQILRQELAARSGPCAADRIHPLVRAIGEQEFRRGLLSAQAGVPGAELWAREARRGSSARQVL